MQGHKYLSSALLAVLIFGSAVALGASSTEFYRPTGLGCAVFYNTDAEGLALFKGTGMRMDFYDEVSYNALIDVDEDGKYNCVITTGPVSNDDAGVIMTYLSNYSARWVAMNWGGPYDLEKKGVKSEPNTVTVPKTEDTKILEGVVVRGKDMEFPRLFFDYIPGGVPGMVPFATLASDTKATIAFADTKNKVMYVTARCENNTLGGITLQHIALQYVTNKVIMGARKIALSPQVDDFFLSNDHLVPVDNVSYHLTLQDEYNKETGDSIKFALGINGMATKYDGETNNYLFGPFFEMYNISVDAYLLPDENKDKYTDPWPDKWYMNETFYGPWFDSFDLAQAALTKEWRDGFLWHSHTFTHPNMAEMSVADAKIELHYNIGMATQILGFSESETWSGKGFISGTYSGMQNGAVWKAMDELGMTNSLSNNDYGPHNYTFETAANFLPYITTVEYNGYEGMTLIPRHATRIDWNAATPEENLAVWDKTAFGFKSEEEVNEYDCGYIGPLILSLRQDPLMYHQSNMNLFQYENETQSLLSNHVFSLSKCMHEYISLPFTSYKQDELYDIFMNRLALNNCDATVMTQRSDGTTFNYVSVSISSDKEPCQVPMEGVTLPTADSDEASNAVLTNKDGIVVIQAEPGKTFEWGKKITSGGETKCDLNQWTSWYTDGLCAGSKDDYSCAQCVSGGCQCGGSNGQVCVECGVGNCAAEKACTNPAIPTTVTTTATSVTTSTSISTNTSVPSNDPSSNTGTGTATGSSTNSHHTTVTTHGSSTGSPSAQTSGTPDVSSSGSGSEVAILTGSIVGGVAVATLLIFGVLFHRRARRGDNRDYVSV
eukprot:Clim_evm17s50 gene=Clim_evmTU17s50